MSKEFKEKLTAYEKGELEGEDLKAFERELAKLEEYQDYLEENEAEPISNKDTNKQKKILRRSKWKARFQTALSAIGILIILAFLSSVVTSLYYTWGIQIDLTHTEKQSIIQ